MRLPDRDLVQFNAFKALFKRASGTHEERFLIALVFTCDEAYEKVVNLKARQIRRYLRMIRKGETNEPVCKVVKKEEEKVGKNKSLTSSTY